MTYEEFLEQVIIQGIEAAKVDYTDPKDKENLDGSIAGFEACRKKNPFELVEVLGKANSEVNNAYAEQKSNYWFYRCFHSEVEWVCNVVSAMLINQGNQTLISYLPTARGMMKAAEIIGIAQNA